METKPNQTIFVIYQDDLTRSTAMSFCDELVQRFWVKCCFDITWCSFADLMKGTKAAKATAGAVQANIIVFAVAPEAWVPTEVRNWANALVEKRSEREGALVGLLDPSPSGDGTTNAYTWVRNLAHRAGLDYLIQAPVELNVVPESAASCTARASAVTSVLDEILSYPPASMVHTLPSPLRD